MSLRARPRWAEKYCRELREGGGRRLWERLRRVRYREAEHQEALDQLVGYLGRNADRMDYPGYEQAGWPISSGPMESFCKQLGQRLKGPGMRWSRQNVNSVATLVSLWTNDEWNRYWQPAA